MDAAVSKLNPAAKSFVPKTRLPGSPAAPMELNAGAKEYEHRLPPMAPFVCIVPAPFYPYLPKDLENEEYFNGDDEEEGDAEGEAEAENEKEEETKTEGGKEPAQKTTVAKKPKPEKEDSVPSTLSPA